LEQIENFKGKVFKSLDITNEKRLGVNIDEDILEVFLQMQA